MKNSNFKLNSRPQKKSRRLPILVLVVLLIGVAGGLLFYKHRTDTRNKDAASQAQANEDENLATGNIEGGDIKQNSNETNPTSEPVESTSITVKVASFSQENGTVAVSAVISGGQATGKCTVSFSSPDSRPVTRELSSTTQGSNQQCNVSIPEVEFDKLGEWNLSILYITGTSRATVEQKVTIK